MARETPPPPDQESETPTYRNLFHNQTWNSRRPKVVVIHEWELDVDKHLNLIRKGNGAPVAISYGYTKCTKETLLDSNDACLLSAIAISCGNQVLCIKLDFSDEAEHTVLSTHLFNGENLLVGIDLNRLVLGLYHCYGVEARVVDLLSYSFMLPDQETEPSLGVWIKKYPQLVEDVVVGLFEDFDFDDDTQTIQNLTERAWVVQGLYRNDDTLRSDLKDFPVTEVGHLMHAVSLFLLHCLRRRKLKKVKERLTLAQLVLGVDRLRAQQPLFTEHRAVEGYVDGTTIRLQSKEYNTRVMKIKAGVSKVR